MGLIIWLLIVAFLVTILGAVLVTIGICDDKEANATIGTFICIIGVIASTSGFCLLGTNYYTPEDSTICEVEGQ